MYQSVRQSISQSIDAEQKAVSCVGRICTALSISNEAGLEPSVRGFIQAALSAPAHSFADDDVLRRCFSAISCLKLEIKRKIAVVFLVNRREK